ncbi:uncharacterized protein LOC103369148 [Stegastes partitus]|uniref:Uncharacterized protein LOC103369148 n=1 Tax=Stegastes partitus TaxID=144197 RepID=A0A9Y4NEX9_9TELE|nr:PREDICTED: uncharacterized protein LOC103369148 [Stegastes partitus]
MWTVVILLHLWVLRCTVSSSPPSPVNVSFSSVNLRNVLHWFPAGGAPEHTHFTVEYAVFGPPLVSVERLKNNSVIVTLTGPMRFQPNNHTPVVSMATLYPQMTYNLSIQNSHRNQVHHFSVAASPLRYQLLDYSTEYCFSAQSAFLSMPIQCQSSARHCITTPKDPVIEQMQWVVVGVVVPSLCVCLIAVAAYLLHHYLTGKDQKSPYILNPPSFHPPPLACPPEKLNVILISVINNDSLSEARVATSNPSKPQLRITGAAPPPSYFPQGAETPPLLGEHWDDSSVDYGFVSPAPKINDRRCDEGDGGSHRGGEDKTKEDDHSAGGYAPQARSAHTCKPIHMTEVSTPGQVHAWSQVNLSQTSEVNRKVELPGLFINKNQQTGLLGVPLNLKKEVGWEETIHEEMRVRADWKKEVDKDENVPLLSGYASQNVQNTPRSDQSDLLPDDYGIVRPAAAPHDDYHDDDGEEEEEQGAICVNWDPETRKLVLPEFGGGRGLMLPYRGRPDMMGGEDEEAYVMKGELKLENVFVRQASEEEEAQRQLEKVRATRWEVDDILTKWNLTISMDQ